ncbi:MAG: hypothetical protein JWR88_1700 [Pseudonocardia sp.]|nr:hypothetical protein [Pseudonocardia sp.]
MKRISLWLLSTVAVVMLIFGYNTSTAGPMSPTTSKVAAAPPAGSPATAAPSTATSGARTVAGSVAQTRWGPVQVQISVSSGRITAVTVPQYPNGNSRDQQINDSALPILVQNTLSAQSAQIDMVSGATVTSEGYVQSLQSAIDKAGL